VAHLTDLRIWEVDDSVVQISKEVYHVMLLQYEFLKTIKSMHLPCRRVPP
jgi:hypothetical protein